MTSQFMSKKTVDILSVAVTGSLIFYALYLIFLVVPNERFMGPVQRIFYFHVGAAIASYLAVGVVLIASLYYMATRDIRADTVSMAAGEAGFLFSSIVMLSGMTWGHSAWNTWFRFEPRLVTFLVLWLIFLTFILLRQFGEQKKIPEHSAVLGILGALTVPMVIYSIKLLPAFAQLHPEVITKGGLADDDMEYGLLIGILAMTSLLATLIWIRTRIGLLEKLITG